MLKARGYLRLQGTHLLSGARVRVLVQAVREAVVLRLATSMTILTTILGCTHDS
tara:strand:- start:4509 stop:4670 length:162 start_codon:yes stop_codon:yes gene_type:complete